MARSAAASFEMSDGNLRNFVPVAFSSTSRGGWGIYGPLQLDAGIHHLRSSSGLVVGPLIRWSPTASTILSGRAAAKPLATASFDAERVVALPHDPAPSWFELRETKDAGWRTANSSNHLQGGSLFNLFFVQHPEGSQVFWYSTHDLESVGMVLAVVWTGGGVLLAVLARRRLPKFVTRVRSDVETLTVAAQIMAIIGAVVLPAGSIFYALAWSGNPWPPRNPYGLSEFYVAVAMGALASSCFLYAISLTISGVRKS
jgi:hypothetical protein